MADRCGASAPVRTEDGDVLWTFECTLDAGAHPARPHDWTGVTDHGTGPVVHESRDVDGTVLAWWPDGQEFFVADVRLEHRDPPADPPAPATCAACRHWAQGDAEYVPIAKDPAESMDDYRGRQRVASRSWGRCDAVEGSPFELAEGAVAYAVDYEGTGGGLVTHASFSCASYERAAVESPPAGEAPVGFDTWSSASRQHYIDTGKYLPAGPS